MTGGSKDLKVLSGEYADVPLNGGDQSGVLWDAPLRILVVTARLDRPMCHFIPDTDWCKADRVLEAEMAATRMGATVSNKGTTLAGSAPWPVMTGLTDLWSKPGSVTPFTPHWWREHGVDLVRLAILWRRNHPTRTHEDFYRRATGVPGYRSIVWSGDTPASQLPARVILPDLLRELREYYRRLSLSVDPKLRGRVRKTGEDLIVEIRIWHAKNQKGTVGELWQYLIGWKAARMGVEKELLTTSSSTQFFSFTADTADQPQFWVLDQFLGPLGNRWVASYDAAIAGTDGEALQTGSLVSGESQALPFDVTIDGKGKGTLVIGPGGVRVVNRSGKVLLSAENESPATVQRLAEILGQAGRVAVDGKARTLVLQLLRADILVLPEQGSMYTAEVAAMVKELEKVGIRAALYPILRVRLKAWESMPAGMQLRLPIWMEWLRKLSRKEWVSGSTVRQNWREWVKEAADSCRILTRPALETDDLLAILAANDRRWSVKRRRWLRFGERQEDLRRRLAKLRSVLEGSREQQKEIRKQADEIERQSGIIRRQIKPLLERELVELNEAERTTLQSANEERGRIAVRAQAIRIEAEGLNPTVESWQRRIERVELELARLRDLQNQIVLEAGLARIELVRQMEMVLALEYSNLRPVTAWIELDPSGRWLAEIVRTAQFRLEWLSPWTFDAAGNEVRVEDLLAKYQGD